MLFVKAKERLQIRDLVLGRGQVQRSPGTRGCHGQCGSCRPGSGRSCRDDWGGRGNPFTGMHEPNPIYS